MNMNSRNVTYSTVGDYQLPNLTLNQPRKPLGKYGRMRLNFLKQDPAPDKAQNQLMWVQHMNSLKAQAEELVLTELIYS